MVIIKPNLGDGHEQITHATQGDAKHKPKRVTVGFKIDEETYNLGLELFPLRGELAAVIRDIFMDEVLALKNNPERLETIRAKYMENLKVRRSKDKVP
jgi:hypothetical protein